MPIEIPPHFILLSMIFLHIVADFHLQGILGTMKQKEFWEKNYPDKKYRHDYIVALILHGFEWSFIVHIPIILCLLPIMDKPIVGVLAMNLLLHGYIHSFVDNAKANTKCLSLVADQALHLAQLSAILVVYYFLLR